MRNLLTLVFCVVISVSAFGQELPNASQRLNQRIPEVVFDNARLDEVFDWLSDYADWNVIVRWRVLEEAGILRDKPVSLKLKNLSLSQVLWLLLNDAAGETKLAYKASGSVLIISTDEDLSKELIVKVYDVGDLLLRTPKASAPQMDFAQGLGQNGGGNLWQGNQSNAAEVEDPAVRIEELIELITSTISPDSWSVNGGKGQIRAFHSLLVVSNSIKVHQELGGYIKE